MKAKVNIRRLQLIEEVLTDLYSWGELKSTVYFVRDNKTVKEVKVLWGSNGLASVEEASKFMIDLKNMTSLAKDLSKYEIELDRTEDKHFEDEEWVENITKMLKENIKGGATCMVAYFLGCGI